MIVYADRIRRRRTSADASESIVLSVRHFRTALVRNETGEEEEREREMIEPYSSIAGFEILKTKRVPMWRLVAACSDRAPRAQFQLRFCRACSRLCFSCPDPNRTYPPGTRQMPSCAGMRTALHPWADPARDASAVEALRSRD